MSIPGVSPGGPFPRDASRPPRFFLVLASDFQRTFRFRIELFIQPLFFVEADCKGTTFLQTDKHFFQLFFHFLASR